MSNSNLPLSAPDKKKSQFFAIFKFVIGLSLAAFFIKFFIENKEVFSQLKNISVTNIILISLLILVIFYISGLTQKILARPFGINLKEHFQISIASTFLNLVTPIKGGLGLRAIYLKKLYNLDYSKFIASLYGNYLLIIFILSASLAISLFILAPAETGAIHKILPLQIFFSLIAIFCLGNIFFHFKIPGQNFIVTKINLILKSWEQIAKHPKLIKQLCLSTILTLTTTSLINFYVFAAIGTPINFLQAFFIATMGSLSIFVNITPGGLGVTESFYFLAGNIINISEEQALLAALVIRAISIILIIPLGAFFNFKLIKKMRSIENTKISTS